MPEWNADLQTAAGVAATEPDARSRDRRRAVAAPRRSLRAAARRGAGEEAARQLALEELRDHDTIAREMRALRQARTPAPIADGSPRRGLLRDVAQDLRYAVRMLRKQPGLHRRGRADAGARHRRQHRGLQPGQRDAVPAPAGRQPRAAGLHVPRRQRRLLVSAAARCCASTALARPGRRGAASPPACTPATPPSSCPASSSPATSSRCSASGRRCGRLLSPPRRRHARGASGRGDLARLLADAVRRAAPTWSAARFASTGTSSPSSASPPAGFPGPQLGLDAAHLRADDDAGDHPAAAGALLGRTEPRPAATQHQQLDLRHRPAEGRASRVERARRRARPDPGGVLPHAGAAAAWRDPAAASPSCPSRIRTPGRGRSCARRRSWSAARSAPSC